jgi:hypothetical protein
VAGRKTSSSWSWFTKPPWLSGTVAGHLAMDAGIHAACAKAATPEVNVTVECSRCATALGVASHPWGVVVYAMAVGGVAGGLPGGTVGGGDVGELGGAEGGGGAAGSTTGVLGGDEGGGGGGGGGGCGGCDGDATTTSAGGSEGGAAAAPSGQKQPPAWSLPCAKEVHAVFTYQYSVSGFARAVK